MATAPPSVRASSDKTDSSPFASCGARRLLVLTGIGMILVGMILGDIFAVFILHQNAARVGTGLSDAAHGALAGDVAAVAANFQKTGGFLENRGTKVDTHVHLIGFGYLALMLAILQPWVALRAAVRRRLAWLFLFGGVLLPVGVFLIHYIGRIYSPLRAIGWASIFADVGGLLVLFATVVYLIGVWRYFRNREQAVAQDDLLQDRSVLGQRLIAGGLLLVLAGFAHGSYYAAADLYRHEAADFTILSRMSVAAGTQNVSEVSQALVEYGQLQGEKAVNIAAHAHFIEFGILAMLLAFFQPYVSLQEKWKRRWGNVLLAGSALLPVCVLLELKFGLYAGGLADFGGMLVIVAMMAMWIGIVRYTGALDSEGRAGASGGSRQPATQEKTIELQKMSGAKRLLLLGGIALATLGMAYGLWYAVSAEHQALDGIGQSLESGFSASAQRNQPMAQSSLQVYREAKYNYDRQVDVHGHWIGLALLLLVLGIGFDRTKFGARAAWLVALSLLLGSVIFPLGVLLQTWSHGPAPRAVAVLGSALVIAALAGTILGFSTGATREKLPE